MNIKGSKFDLLINIVGGVSLLVFYFWIISDGAIQEVIDDYLIITQEKTVTKGLIIKAEEFEDIIETNEGRTVEVVNGYYYIYTFSTLNNKKIEVQGGNYGELPLKKTINDIPYEIEIEYLNEKPEINRIKGQWSNNTSLWSWFRRMILFKIVVLIVCLFISYEVIKRGIEKFNNLS